jgi:hypothetical protein
MATIEENRRKSKDAGLSALAAKYSSPIVPPMLGFIAGGPIHLTDRIPLALLPGLP